MKFYRRTFTLFIADDPWESGEIILPKEYGKAQIWAHLQTLHSIPDVSQFQVVCDRKEISKDAIWPSGHIEAVPVRFPVTWHIEYPQNPDGFFAQIQEGMTPLLTAQAAWGLLRNDVPNLQEEPEIDYRGFLKPGLTLNASIPRVNVRVSVSFEVIREGCITFTHEVFLNMMTWREIYGHYSSIDARICPWENYIDEELRPYYQDMPLRFKLNKSKEVPDTTREFGGVSGGLAPDGTVLPPIIFPKPAIDMSSKQYPKITGGGTGPVATGSDSSSDSSEEEDVPEETTEEQRLQLQAISDDHRLHNSRRMPKDSELRQRLRQVHPQVQSGGRIVSSCCGRVRMAG
jgi:hypothetical protein